MMSILSKRKRECKQKTIILNIKEYFNSFFEKVKMIMIISAAKLKTIPKIIFV